MNDAVLHVGHARCAVVVDLDLVDARIGDERQIGALKRGPPKCNGGGQTQTITGIEITKANADLCRAITIGRVGMACLNGRFRAADELAAIDVVLHGCEPLGNDDLKIGVFMQTVLREFDAEPRHLGAAWPGPKFGSLAFWWMMQSASL